VFAFEGHATEAVDAGLIKDGKESFRIRHLFAFSEVRVGVVMGVVKEDFVEKEFRSDQTSLTATRSPLKD
jgi:hypothetical protein